MITSEFQTKVADLVNSSISRVVINEGALEIETFEIKAVTDNVLAMNYMIPNGAVESVTLIELMNDLGELVSSNSVIIPITSDTLVIQAITVEEAV